MYLKKLKLINFRKFTEVNNEIEFVASNSMKKKEDDRKETLFKIDIASDTTLIVGKNNVGKTTIITALEKLISTSGKSFNENDFNFTYLKSNLEDYIKNNKIELPFIRFEIVVGLEDDMENDIISNITPFMAIEDIQTTEITIIARYEVKDAQSYKNKMDEMIKGIEKADIKQKVENPNFMEYLDVLKNTDFILNYYDKEDKKLDKDFKLSNLMEITCIKANHIKNENCIRDAFNKIIRYQYQNIFEEGERKKFGNTLKDMSNKLSEILKKNQTKPLENALKKIVSSEKVEVNLEADLTFEKLIKDLIRYEYIENGVGIPENQFGLGYTNLVMIIATIIDYVERYPENQKNSKINLISIEEPETFMHPQMQELFIKNINDAIRILLKEKNKDINSQIIITTHSSHILNSKIHSKNTFDNISYLFEKDYSTNIVNLTNEKVNPCGEASIKSEEFQFLKKHIKYKASELFFSDAIIFVEGYAEDVVLPYYLENREELNKNYISIFNINGAHAYIYKRLIHTLGIPTLIVTDLDIKRTDDEKENYTQITDIGDKKTTNKTIINFNNGQVEIPNMEYIEEDNIYLAYQGKIEEVYATSFEEAFILSNYDNEILNNLLKELKPGIYKDIVGKNKEYEKNIDKSYKWQEKLSDDKGKFASMLLFELISNATNPEKDQKEQKEQEGEKEEYKKPEPKLPDYIEKGLQWLETKLKERRKKWHYRRYKLKIWNKSKKLLINYVHIATK